MAALAVLFGAFGVVSAASAADGDTRTVSESLDNVTVNGTILEACKSPGDPRSREVGGSYALNLHNGDSVDQLVEVYLYGASLTRPVEQLFSRTLAPGEDYYAGASYAVGYGVESWSVGVIIGTSTVYSGVFECAIPAPTATVSIPNLVYDAPRGFVQISGTAELENAPDGSAQSVVFTVSGPGDPTAGASPLVGGGYGSSFPVTPGDDAQDFTVVAHVTVNGDTIADSEVASITIPAVENGGGDPTPTPSPTETTSPTPSNPGPGTTDSSDQGDADTGATDTSTNTTRRAGGTDFVGDVTASSSEGVPPMVWYAIATLTLFGASGFSLLSFRTRSVAALRKQ